MKLDELKRIWISEEQPEVQQRIWDRAADGYRARPLPSFESDDFLKLLRDMTPDMAGKRFLDVGCGAGIYSLAIAKEGGQVVGVDISPKMIEHACERAVTDHIAGTEFFALNWADADIDALEYRGAFDVAFAHMTPAVCNYATFDKLNACSRGLCLVQKPTRRNDVVQDETFRRVGIGLNEKHSSDVDRIFSYLWNSGYSPSFHYKKEVWKSERTTEDMVAWCTDRARLKKTLTNADEQTIREYVEGIAVNGMVTETVNTTRVTIAWRVDE